MSDGLQFIRLSIRDYRSGIRSLTPIQRAAYLDLLLAIYEEGGPVEWHDRSLAGWLNTSIRKARSTVLSLVEEGVIYLIRDDGETLHSDNFESFEISFWNEKQKFFIANRRA